MSRTDKLAREIVRCDDRYSKVIILPYVEILTASYSPKIYHNANMSSSSSVYIIMMERTVLLRLPKPRSIKIYKSVDDYEYCMEYKLKNNILNTTRKSNNFIK